MNLTRLAALSFRGSHVWAVHGVIGVMTLGMLWGGGALGRAESRARELRLLVRSAFEDFPLTLGGSEEWMFVDEVEIPTTQVAMLGLNTYVSRVYRRLGSPSTRHSVPRECRRCSIHGGPPPAQLLSREWLDHAPPNTRGEAVFCVCHWIETAGSDLPV